MKKTHNYSNGEITIHWHPEKCIHSGVCVRELPEVYHPKEKPWIKPQNASTAELKSQVSKCPSGALRYTINDPAEALNPVSPNVISVEVSKNGPYLVRGMFELIDRNGIKTFKENVNALCRCGASGNKPFCDGSHKKIGFED